MKHPVIKLREFESRHGTDNALMIEYSYLVARPFKTNQEQKRAKEIEKLLREHRELYTYAKGYEAGWKEAVERLEAAYGEMLLEGLG